MLRGRVRSNNVGLGVQSNDQRGAVRSINEKVVCSAMMSEVEYGAIMLVGGVQCNDAARWSTEQQCWSWLCRARMQLCRAMTQRGRVRSNNAERAVVEYGALMAEGGVQSNDERAMMQRCGRGNNAEGGVVEYGDYWLEGGVQSKSTDAARPSGVVEYGALMAEGGVQSNDQARWSKEINGGWWVCREMMQRCGVRSNNWELSCRAMMQRGGVRNINGRKVGAEK
ncbi:hypothetical protein Nepgr_033815 [Nepenthes gracilis]|uniref:Uncharacterized protein n=1 Tax=Nepenthes gracilis TaxID=150966 RepID=A0AAD3TMM3_NEPGR|nr:hypothetical protein Nepgr_033815 [Nepenthes gracilis]